MFELLTLILFVWLMVKAVGLVFRLSWGVAKIVAGILIGVAVPLLFFCLIFIGGILLLLPLAVVALALLVVKACT